MAYRIQRTRTSLPGTAGGVRANINVDTGSQQVSQALSGFGEALGKEGLRLDMIEADTQFTAAKAAARQEHYKFLMSLESMSPDQYYEAYEKSKEARSKLVPKNGRAAHAFDNWSTSIEPYFYEQASGAWQARLYDDYRAEGFSRRQEFIETGNGEYFGHLVKGVKNGAYDAEEAAKLRQGAIDNRNSYMKFQEAQAKARRKEELDAYVEENEQEWFTDLIGNKLDITKIKNSTVPANVKLRWKGIYDTWQKNTLAGKEAETDIVLKGQLEDMAINLRQGTVGMPEARAKLAEAYAQKKLKDTDYEAVLDLMRREFRAGQLETLDGRFKANLPQLVDLPSEYDLEQRLEILKPSERETVISLRQRQLKNYDNYKQALLKYHKDNPEATIGEIYEYGENLLSVYLGYKNQSQEEMEGRAALRSATKKHGQEELAKAKDVMKEGKPDYTNQIDYLRLTFNLTPEEVETAKQWLEKGESLDSLTRYLQSIK